MKTHAVPNSARTSRSQPMRWMISMKTVGRSDSGLLNICSRMPCSVQDVRQDQMAAELRMQTSSTAAKPSTIGAADA